MSKTVTKAVFPVAGLGTRFLPATKASPKEMLNVVDKPLIQYAVEEAMAAGITEMIFVTSDAIAKVKAGDLVNHVAQQVGGKGGGKPDMAMAGGTDPKGLPAALNSVQAWVSERL